MPSPVPHPSVGFPSLYPVIDPASTQQNQPGSSHQHPPCLLAVLQKFPLHRKPLRVGSAAWHLRRFGSMPEDVRGYRAVNALRVQLHLHREDPGHPNGQSSDGGNMLNLTNVRSEPLKWFYRDDSKIIWDFSALATDFRISLEMPSSLTARARDTAPARVDKTVMAFALLACLSSPVMSDPIASR